MTTLHRKRSGFRESAADRAFGIVNAILLIVIAFTMVYPLYFVIVASFSDPFDVVNGRVFLWVRNFTTESYGYVFNNSLLWSGYGNSIVNTICAVAYNLGILIPAAYVLSRQDLPGRSFFNLLFLVTMFFGGGMVPTYLMYRSFGMLNTRWALILTAISCYNLVVARTYFQTAIPEVLYEAARIDGASDFRCFFQIALPLAGSIVAVIALFCASASWNGYYSALLYIRDQKLYPLQLVLRDILITAQNAYKNIDASSAGEEGVFEQALRLTYLAESMKYAVIFIASFPMLAMYPFAQKFFVKGVLIGAVKG